MKGETKLSSRNAAIASTNAIEKDRSPMHQLSNTSPQSINQPVSDRNTDSSVTPNGGMNYGKKTTTMSLPFFWFYLNISLKDIRILHQQIQLIIIIHLPISIYINPLRQVILLKFFELNHLLLQFSSS